LSFSVNDDGLMYRVETGEVGRAVWITGAPSLLDAFRALSVFCDGTDPGAPTPDAPDTDNIPRVPDMPDTFQFDGSCA
jgi:hypothetical protein